MHMIKKPDGNDDMATELPPGGSIGIWETAILVMCTLHSSVGSEVPHLLYRRYDRWPCPCCQGAASQVSVICQRRSAARRLSTNGEGGRLEKEALEAADEQAKKAVEHQVRPARHVSIPSDSPRLRPHQAQSSQVCSLPI